VSLEGATILIASLIGCLNLVAGRITLLITVLALLKIVQASIRTLPTSAAIFTSKLYNSDAIRRFHVLIVCIKTHFIERKKLHERKKGDPDTAPGFIEKKDALYCISWLQA